MQAITLWQPWATLIALGLKTIETRSRRPPMTRPVWLPHGLAIHAAQRTPMDQLRAAFQNPLIRAALADHGITETNWMGGAGSLPQGAIVAVVSLRSFSMTHLVLPNLTAIERAAGDYSMGRFAWQVGDTINLNDMPQAVRGRQGIWAVPPAIVQNLNLAAQRLDRLPAGGFR